MLKILVVDDDDLIHATIKTIFKNDSVSSAFNRDEAGSLLQKDVFDVAFLDIQLTKDSQNTDGIDLLKSIREKDRYLPCIMSSGLEDKNVILQCLELGAVDYVIKGKSQPDAYRLATIKAAAWKRLLTEAPSTRTLDPYTGTYQELVDIKGSSSQIQELKASIAKLAQLPGPFLILGDTGTGKELVARALWAGKKNKNRPFVAVNCASLPANLIESELFGYEKGAFTGALNTKSGLFEAANGGDIFLDEMGELPPDMQAKLLRTLQEKKVRRVGSDRERPVDFRIIAATNVNLLDAVEEKTFREDLFYRLNVHVLKLPTLRERAGDIVDLLKYFSVMNGFNNLHIQPDAEQKLLHFPWPGNIRQLKAFSDFLVPYLEKSKPTLTLELIDRWMNFNVPRKKSTQATLEPEMHVSQALSSKQPIDLVGLLDGYQRAYVESALKLTQNNRSHAARILGVSRQRLSNWLAEWGIF